MAVAFSLSLLNLDSATNLKRASGRNSDKTRLWQVRPPQPIVYPSSHCLNHMPLVFANPCQFIISLELCGYSSPNMSIASLSLSLQCLCGWVCGHILNGCGTIVAVVSWFAPGRCLMCRSTTNCSRGTRTGSSLCGRSPRVSG